jgi:hypothetical protein
LKTRPHSGGTIYPYGLHLISILFSSEWVVNKPHRFTKDKQPFAYFAPLALFLDKVFSV